MVTSSKATSTLHGYCIHSHRFIKREIESKFWSVQAAIVKELRAKRSLQTLFVFVHNSCDLILADGFRRAAEREGWTLTSTEAYYPDMGDSVADSGTFFVGNHRGATSIREPIRVVPPPASQPHSLVSFLYAPFNSREHAVCLSWRHEDFKYSGCKMLAPESVATPLRQHRAKRVCSIYRQGDDTNISAEAGVYDLAGLCPPFSPLIQMLLAPFLELSF